MLARWSLLTSGLYCGLFQFMWRCPSIMFCETRIPIPPPELFARGLSIHLYPLLHICSPFLASFLWWRLLLFFPFVARIQDFQFFFSFSWCWWWLWWFLCSSRFCFNFFFVCILCLLVGFPVGFLHYPSALVSGKCLPGWGYPCLYQVVSDLV